MQKLLVIEDDLGIQKQLKWSLSDYELIFATTRVDAINKMRRFEPSVVTLDLGLPPDEDNATEGLATLTEIFELFPETKVIVITGNEDKENALRSIEIGAHDFYQKPIDVDILNVIVERAFVVAKLEKENKRLKTSLLDDFGFIGNCAKIQRIRAQIDRVSQTEISTLILGESGTGKEVVARAIHEKGNRKNGAFVAINCASIPENLLESELFGFEKGAFTGAHKMTMGKIEMADGGTLFLDEIGDMPYQLQSKLLRFLQEKVIERIGGRKEIPVDVKIVCATHQDLASMMQNKSFREDLFYRISEISIENPPLREREEDIVLLARYFLNQYQHLSQFKTLGFSEEALDKLQSHEWPGNIRELQNKVKSATIMADSKLISAFDLQLDSVETIESKIINLRQIREEAEVGAINKALSLTQGNVSHTANLLGVARPTLYSLMEKYSLTVNTE